MDILEEYKIHKWDLGRTGFTEDWIYMTRDGYQGYLQRTRLTENVYRGRNWERSKESVVK